MKKLLTVLILLLLAGPDLVRAYAGTKEVYPRDNIKLDIRIDKLLKEPRLGSASNFDIPIGIRLLERTPDKKWYKARISYNFLGYHEFDGWVKVE